MKPLSVPEVQAIAVSLKTLIGSQLQEIMQTEQDVGLGFYHQGETHWLWLDLMALRPLVLLLPGPPKGARKVVKPLLLFIRAHFAGRRLQEVTASQAEGRVIHLVFFAASEDLYQIEIRLFPHGQNVILHAGEKILSLRKRQDLATTEMGTPADEPRSWNQIHLEWQAERGGDPPATDSAVQKSPNKVRRPGPLSESEKIEKEWRRRLEKKRGALAKMEADLATKELTPWSKVGEILKAQGDLHVPAEFREYVDQKRSLAWNIERSFGKGKDFRRKLTGARERISLLKKEIAEIERRGPLANEKNRQATARTGFIKLMEKAAVRGRRLQVAADLEAFIGKSAADNLKLLRMAQPFDFWLHLRERPGSHAILRRTRGRSVSDAEFLQVGRWVTEQSLHKSAEELKGDRFDLLIVECRYVRPIKGDKLGRVHYTNDRVLNLRF